MIPKLETTDPHGPLSEIESLMQKSVLTLGDTDTVRDVLNIMVNQHVSAVPVVNSAGKIVGIVSTADLIRIVLTTDQLFDNDYPRYEDCLWAVDLIQSRFGSDKVSKVMSFVVSTVRRDQTIQQAAQIMVSEQVHHLVVVDADGQLVGILSSGDFVALVAQM